MLLCDKLKRPQTWQNFEAHPARPGVNAGSQQCESRSLPPRPFLRLLPSTREGGSEESLRAEGEEQTGGGEGVGKRVSTLMFDPFELGSPKKKKCDACEALL